ncbi:MAG TPA: hypothetical protein VE987_15420 [Polyangiaceae bacterium]|nr:hypothetical protein [Polyangiaceae bacterium]
MSKVNPSHGAVLRADMPATTPSDHAGAARDGREEAGFVVASHAALFDRDDAVTCDACGRPMRSDDGDGAEDEDACEDGYVTAGAGMYLWARGDEVRRETAPLCASCASAIGMTALARWEIEEEEG